MGGRYQRYPEYIDSGVEWIGEIPQKWEMWKILHACPYVASGTTPKTDSDAYYGGSTLWVTTGELRENVIFDTYKKVTDHALSDIPTLRLHPEGSVAIAMYGATIGRLGIFGKEATTNQACCVLPPSKVLYSKYLFYWLFATKEEIINLSSGGGQPNVNQEKIASLKVSCPDYASQLKIASFLDHETAKIDTLIEKQQQLISLLKEKRQAVISHAVTKGLNPDAPMKDSGVEWLGEVPEHWEVSRVKFHSLVKGRIGFRGYTVEDLVDENEGALVIGATEMTYTGSIVLNSPQYISWKKYYESPEIMLEAGMVLIVQRGSTVGKVAYVEGGLGKATINPSLIVLKNMDINPRYLFFSLMESRIQNVVRMQTSSTAIPMISQEQVGNYCILIPPKEEQVYICAYIDNKAKAIETAINASKESVKLLHERRTALISAAVTGKIDVRNWQPPADKAIQ